jgi:Chromate transporter
MKSESGSLFTLAAFFAVTSLFAVGGGNSAIPEMHRYAVDVQHWLSDRRFADSFALAQLTPGPNLIIVTLIGYHVPIAPQADINRHLASILLDRPLSRPHLSRHGITGADALFCYPAARQG